MKKTIWILISILLGFVYVIGNYLLKTGYLNGGMFGLLLLLYLTMVLLIGFPTLLAFAFQAFACNITQNRFLQMLPTFATLALIILECHFPMYGIYCGILSQFLGFPKWLIIPVVLAGVLGGWFTKTKKGDTSC